MNSDIRASLLNCGFSLSQARAAIEAGNLTVEAATEWIFDNAATIEPRAGHSNTLRLRNETDDTFEAELQQALKASVAEPQPQPQSTEASGSTATEPTASTLAATAHGAPDETIVGAKKIKINIVKSQPSSHVVPPLPLNSRFKDEALEAQNNARVLEANRRAEKVKKDKAMERLARQRTLNAFKEDQEARKLRSQGGAGASSSVTASAAAAMPGALPQPMESVSTSNPAPQPSTPASAKTMVQIRLKNGSVLKKSLDCTSTLKDLFDIARAEDGHLGNADISLIQPFPRREFTSIEGSLTLVEAGLVPSCSLNVFVQAPIVAPQPLAPSARLSDDIEMEEPSSDDDDEQQQPASEENDESMDEDNEAGDESNDEDDQDDMMHALPVLGHLPHGGNPPAGRGRGRGRGRGGMAFAGVGHALGSSSLSASAEQPTTETSTADQDTDRRQRILEAMAHRAKDQGSSTAEAVQTPKKIRERMVPSLQSLCSYEVAVMLTSRSAASAQHLKLLGDNLGSQAAESIVRELIKLNQLDQLSFKRFFRCSLVNIVLDGYSRATDSLLDAVGSCQSRSLMYLSLKSCTFLTDAGFSNIARLEELDFLDLSHCRITDKTLAFTLNLPNLSTLHLSSTKITTGGLAKTIADAAWSTTLQTLDVSYCKGIAGRNALSSLQGLTNLQKLLLNNTDAFGEPGVLLPAASTFQELVHLDLAWTRVCSQDAVALAGVLGTLEFLNLSSCVNVDTHALEQCVTRLPSLQTLRFPNREHDLRSVLPMAASLPLVELDLTGFLFVTDEAILTLEAAQHLQILSLTGTKLTDIGAAVFVHLSSLKELSLGRTSISDKAIEYMRDLARIETLSMPHCGRLTTKGMNSLGRCAFFTLNLKRLHLGENPFIHDEALLVLARALELTSLNLQNTDVTEAKALQLQNSLPHLTQLNIQGITNGAVYEENPRAIVG
ncbi:hypothetical protein EMPS_06839 [Entomortierella parvispora]|uniref:UBX domain-containing protein n=1 Tax=Entomortierella parvispora TaxID=205924 RepID=A0A9P3HCY9_9FUNG|nr:hypothetical protein EMPS_06839 [Entomortierella parvispora]